MEQRIAVEDQKDFGERVHNCIHSSTEILNSFCFFDIVLASCERIKMAIREDDTQTRGRLATPGVMELITPVLPQQQPSAPPPPAFPAADDLRTVDVCLRDRISS